MGFFVGNLLWVLSGREAIFEETGSQRLGGRLWEWLEVTTYGIGVRSRLTRFGLRESPDSISINPMDGYLLKTTLESECLHPPLRLLVMGDLSAQGVAKVSAYGIVIECGANAFKGCQAIRGFRNGPLSMFVVPGCRAASRLHLQP